MTGHAALLDLVRGVAHDFGIEPTPDGVVRSIVQHGAPLGVMATAITTIDAELLVTVAQHGLSDMEVELYRTIPLGIATPGTDAARLGVPVYHSSRAELSGRYGEDLPLAPAVQAFAAVPLAMADATTGALCVAFTREVDFGEEVRNALGSLAGICAASLGIGRRTAVGPRPGDDGTPLAARVASLERDMAALRELLEFLGAIASQRLR